MVLIIDIHSSFFHSTESAIEFLEQNNVSLCKICSCGEDLKIEKHRNIYILRCIASGCRSRKNLLFNTPFDGVKVHLNDVLLVIFYYCYDLRNYQIMGFSQISEPTIIKIKKIIHQIVKNYTLSQYSKIGGENIRVQIDETVIVRGRLIRNPSNASDNIPSSVWLIGGIEESEERKFFLKIIPNRQASTIVEILKEHVHENSIIITDGYPSYIPATRELNLTHVVVNHSTGFVNVDGDHTNNIENIWSHLKSNLKTKHGVLRSEMDNFVSEFWFRKYFIKENRPETINSLYVDLLRYIFR